MQREAQTTTKRSKRRRSSVTSTATDGTSDSECITPTPESTPTPQKRTRGPGKKRKRGAPACEARFRHIHEEPRQEASNPLEVHMVLDTCKLYQAFEPQFFEDVPNDAEGSVVGKIRQRIMFCHTLKRRGSSMVIRAIVQERFELVILAYEFRKATAHVSRMVSRKVRRDFIAELFPGKNPEETQWDYYWQVGFPLLRLVERYGWGVLVFPTLNMTKKRFVFAILGNAHLSVRSIV